IATGKVLATLQAHTPGVTLAAPSADGSLTVTGGGDGQLLAWSTSDPSSSRPLASRSSPVSALRLTPDGRMAVAGYKGGTLHRVDVAQSAVVREVPAHGAAVTALTFSPDLSIVASGAADSMLSLWRLDGLQPLGGWRADNGPAAALDISPSG